MASARQHSWWFPLLVAIVFGQVIALLSQRAEAAEQPHKLRVLIFSGLNNHDWKSTTPVVQKTLTDCPRFGKVDMTKNPGAIDAATLAGYDVIVSNWTPYPDTRRSWRPETETAFLNYIRGGGGFVVFHAAACTFQVWPEFQQLIALTWKADRTAHGAYCTFKVSVEDQEHPIARGLTDFYTTDELYHNMARMTDYPCHVVFKAYSAKEKGGTGKYEPVLDCTHVGRGRGVNIVLGHDAAAMGAGFKTLLLRSAEWAATGNVTIAPPTIWPATPAAMAVANTDPDAVFQTVARYTYGIDRKPLADVQALVVHAGSLGNGDDRSFRRALAERMAALLKSDSATKTAKAFICGKIAAVGNEEQAPVLTALLSDKELAQPALSALAQIPGRSVDRILRDALATLQGNSKVAAVNAIGERRDSAATGPLSTLLEGADEELACAAASALGKIGEEAVVPALQKALSGAKGRLRGEIADACLICANQMIGKRSHALAVSLYSQLSASRETEPVRMAALRGLVLSNPDKAASTVCEALTSGNAALESMAIQLVQEVQGADAAQRLAQCLRTAPPVVQKLLVAALADRRETEVRKAVEEMTSSPDEAVRIAALTALGACGDEDSVELLVDRALGRVTTEEGEAARRSLVRLRGKRFNLILSGMIPTGESPRKVLLIRTLANRNAIAVVPDLVRAVDDMDAAVRKETWIALGGLARESDAAKLIDLLVRAPASERAEAEQAVISILRRPTRPDVRAALAKLEAASAPAARVSIIRVVSAAGDDLAVPALRKAVQSEDKEVRDAAIHGLAAWPSPVPFEDLVNLARHTTESSHRALALRAAIRLSGTVVGRSPEKLAVSLSELLQLSRNASERKAVLAELGRCPTLAALRLAQGCLADVEVATEAGVAMTQIGSSIGNTHRDEIAKALTPLLGDDRDAFVAGRAAKVLIEVLKPLNLSIGATASNPDGLAADGAAGGPQAAIDGNPNTYWDEVDYADEYRLRVTFRQPTDVSSINILWHPYLQHQAKNFDIVCDGKTVKKVRGAECIANQMYKVFEPVRCKSVELVIPGKNGLVSPCIHEFQVFAGFPANTPGIVVPKQPKPLNHSWNQTDKELTLFSGDRVVWQWNYGKDLAKPYFHPIALTDGTVLTAPSPADHPWHRGFWFSWKMINGVNYWEENPATGKVAGLTDVRAAKVTPRPDGSARIDMEITYHPAGAAPVLTEHRLIDVGAANKSEVYQIDWRSVFAAGEKDVLLQGGTAGGGYAGLSARVSQASSDWILIDSEGRRDVPADSNPQNASDMAVNSHGKQARWADFSLIDNNTRQPGGIAILDHPSNPRHPSQWHNILAANARFGYFSPAMLWSESYRLPAGQRFTLRYRILVHPGRGKRDVIQKQWQAFASQP
jgi:HEAT repeat protein/type 1 glutamine amidotransferase